GAVLRWLVTTRRRRIIATSLVLIAAVASVYPQERMKSGAISCSSSAVSVRVQHGQCEDPRVAIRRGLFRARGKAGAPRCGSACEATPIISSTSLKRRSHEEKTCIRDRYCAAGLGAHALRSRQESRSNRARDLQRVGAGYRSHRDPEELQDR